MGRADVYLQPGAADPVLSDPVVLGLARRHVPGLQAVTGVDESGGEARVYVLDQAIIFKVQRPHRLRPRTSLAKEAYLLDRLRQELGGRIPAPLGYDRVETEQGPVEYLCMTRMTGQAARDAPLSAGHRRALLLDLGVVLRTVHGVRFEASRLPTDKDAAALRTRLESGFADLLDALAERGAATVPLPSTVDEVVERALSAVPAALTQPPVLLHSNPGATHVFVEPPTGRFTGLIDFGDSYVSHPALDLHRWPDPADRALLRDAYLDGAQGSPEFNLMWTIAMVHSDLAAMAAGSRYATDAARDLSVRLAEL